jgi:hypothetical protein
LSKRADLSEKSKESGIIGSNSMKNNQKALIPNSEEDEDVRLRNY